MGELWPSQPGSKPLSTSDDRQFAKCLLPARPSGSAGYITEKKQCDVKGGESQDSDPDEAQTGAFDWRAYYPPPAEAADEDVVIGASQSEDEDDRSLAQRWPGLWRGATRGGGRGSADESEDEEVFPAAACGFGFPESPRRPPLQHSQSTPVHVHSQPTPVHVHSQPSPVHVHSQPSPVHVHSLLSPVYSPRPEHVKPRFTLQKCTGISPLLVHVPARSPQPSPSRPSASSQRSPRRSSQRSTPRSARRVSSDSDPSTQSSRRSTRRSSQSSRRSSKSSSSHRRRRTSLFLKRTPLRSPPLRSRSHSPDQDDDSSLSDFNTDDISLYGDLLASSLSRDSSTPGNTDPSSCPVEGGRGRSRCPDVEEAAREINQDHLYSMMCVGDVVEVEVESARTPPDTAAMTPDSLEEGVRVDVDKEPAGASAGRPPAGLLADYIVWKDSTSNLLRAFTDLSVEDTMGLEREEDTLAGGDPDHRAAEDEIVGAGRVVGVEHPAEGSCALNQDPVVEVQHPAGGSCVLNQNPVVEVRHPAGGTCTPDEGLVVEVQHPAEGSCALNQDPVVEVQHPAGGTCAPDEGLVVEVEHPAQGSCALNQDPVVEIQHRAGGTPDEDLVLEVEHPAEGSCALNQDPVVDVQHPAEGTCAQDEDLFEHPVELTCTQNRVVGMGHVVQGALDESCLPAQAKDGDGCGVKGAWGDGSFYRRQRGSPLGPGSDARARFSQKEYDVIINNSIGACCSKLPGEGTLHPESEGSTSEDNDSFSGQTYKHIELKDDCSRGASEVFDPSEIEDSSDSAPGYSVIDTHNESTDLFDDNLADLAQQVESDDDLIPFQLPKQDSAYQGVVNVAPRFEDRSSFNSSIGDSWVPASMKQLSGANSLSEIKNCNFNLMRSEEVNVCTQIQSENNQGEEFVVDIEAEALRQFTYHEVDTISRDERHSDLLQNEAHGDDAEHMSGNPKLSLQDDLEVSRSSSSSPNRDIDALYLTQCAPLKRKASFRGEKHPATKKTRRSWEQWYQQFKTIVVTGREKLTAQNSQILTDEKKKSLNPFSIESDSSDSVNVVGSFEIHNQPTTSLMRQSCVGKLEPVNYDSQDNESDDEIQPSNVTVNDQLVPEQNNVDRINSSCNKKKLLDLKKPLFGWSSVEPSLKGVNDFPPRDSMRTTEMLRTPPMTQRPVRVGLSKRAHPKPLHVRRQWWVLSAVREICSIQ